MLPDQAVPLSDDSRGCVLESTPRMIQSGDIHYVSLNPQWLSQLAMAKQGTPTVHALATRPVLVQNPAYIIQPAEVIDG